MNMIGLIITQFICITTFCFLVYRCYKKIPVERAGTENKYFLIGTMFIVLLEVMFTIICFDRNPWLRPLPLQISYGIIMSIVIFLLTGLRLTKTLYIKENCFYITHFLLTRKYTIDKDTRLTNDGWARRYYFREGKVTIRLQYLMCSKQQLLNLETDMKAIIADDMKRHGLNNRAVLNDRGEHFYKPHTRD